IPPHLIEYKGTQLREFDLDAALARPPRSSSSMNWRTNAPGSRHPKRWQDVEELLAAGIDVWHDRQCAAHRKPARCRRPDHRGDGAGNRAGSDH
ncbi:MAG: hypothetical protein IPK17_00425, partial [Chloroflexi bacterium]|nr:hypothetical protein [Chloroflexota bacterium]